MRRLTVLEESPAVVEELGFPLKLREYVLDRARHNPEPYADILRDQSEAIVLAGYLADLPPGQTGPEAMRFLMVSTRAGERMFNFGRSTPPEPAP